MPTIVLLSQAQHLHGALDARDQSVVRQGLGPQEPCSAEAAGEELQRGGCWLSELVEVEPTAHQEYRVRRGTILEEYLEGAPRPVGLGAREAYSHGRTPRTADYVPWAQPRHYLPRPQQPVVTHVEDRHHQEIVSVVQVAEWQETGPGDSGIKYDKIDEEIAPRDRCSDVLVVKIAW